MTSRRSERNIGPFELQGLSNAISVVEQIVDCTMLALVCRDEKGCFVLPLPGSEESVLQLLAAADWQSALRKMASYKP